MSIPDPGGSFSTGPSTSPIITESPAVSSAAPNGPAPGTGPLASYVDAKPTTAAQKAALLSSIAQLGSAGKQAWVQQEQQNNQTRVGAIASMSAAGGMAGTPTGALPGIQSAFAGQQQAATNQQGSLDAYDNTLAGAAGTWYDRTNAAIPIMEERSKQQVNSYYAAQRLQAQKDAAQLALQNQAMAASRAQAGYAAQAAQSAQAESRIRLQIGQTELAKAQASASGQLSPGEQIAALNLGHDKNAQAFQNELQGKIDAMNAIQDQSGSKHGDKFRDIFTSIVLASKGDPNVARQLIDKAQTQGALNNVVRPDVLQSWLSAYFGGTNSGWRNLPDVTIPGVGGPDSSGGFNLNQQMANQFSGLLSHGAN